MLPAGSLADRGHDAGSIAPPSGGAPSFDGRPQPRARAWSFHIAGLSSPSPSALVIGVRGGSEPRSGQAHNSSPANTPPIGTERSRGIPELSVGDTQNGQPEYPAGRAATHAMSKAQGFRSRLPRATKLSARRSAQWCRSARSELRDGRRSAGRSCAARWCRSRAVIAEAVAPRSRLFPIAIGDLASASCREWARISRQAAGVRAYSATAAEENHLQVLGETSVATLATATGIAVRGSWRAGVSSSTLWW